MEAAPELNQFLVAITNMQHLPRSSRILFLWFCKCFAEGSKPREELVIPAHSDPNSNLAIVVKKASRKLSTVSLLV